MSDRSLDRPIAMVLGGTVPHCELIRQLQGRGYYVILIDYLPDSPARSVADEHIQESTLDKETVLEIAKQRGARLVISGCVDQANITACYVMEQLGLYAPYDYQTALRVTNKGEMKRVMWENGIPTSRYFYLEDSDLSRMGELRFPVMVKPADSNSSNGVKKARDAQEALKDLEDALRISRNHRAIVEEYVTGTEISAYCFIKDGQAKLLMTAERLSIMDGPDKVIKCYATISPARIPEKLERRAEEVATMIAGAFGLKNTPLFFQAIVNGDDLSVIEFAPRVGGGSCFKTIKGNTGFDIITATIDAWLNIPVDFETWHAPSSLYVVNTVYGRDGEYAEVTGERELLEQGTIEELLRIRARGDRLDNSRASSSRVCFFIVKAKDEQDMLDRAAKVFERLDVLDPAGSSLIRREISLPALLNRKP